MPFGEVNWPRVDERGPAKPPENRKLKTRGFTSQAGSHTARKYSNAIGYERLRRTATDR